uniref:TEP1-F n=1 Tax=Anopheles epiroticus TaxID=199890 RepID=A0A182P1U7_9DIPT
MWQFVTSRILTVIIFIGAAHGLFVVGPKFIRANQDYTLVISNFNSHLSKVDLMLKLEGQTHNSLSMLNVTKMIDVRRNMNRMVNFNMPEHLSNGTYKITIDGQRGFSFHKEAELVYLSKSISGLIQINKPVFKPGDTVKFRVIVLDTELKPPAGVKSVHVTISDPQNNVIRRWSTAKLYAGVFESDLQIAPTPMLGIWNILVQVEGEELVTKTFEVKEYVLSSFDLQVMPTAIPLEEHQALNLTIAANYHFGKPVQGVAKVELYLEDDKLDQKRELEMFGMGQVYLRFNGALELHYDQQDVQVKVTFTEQFTNRTMVKESKITVYKYKYRMELVKESPHFRPGLPFKCELQFRYHNGTPAAGITGKVEVSPLDYEETETSDSNGLIRLVLPTAETTDAMDISFSNNDDGFYFYETVDKVEIVANAYIKLELLSPIKLNRQIHLMVTCNERMTFFVYYVVSKGNIIDSGFMRPSKTTKYPLKLNATEKMIPKAKIVVVTVVSQAMVYDIVDINFNEFRNKFDVTISQEQVAPGQQIVLNISGPSGAYVALAAYDKGLATFSECHDIFWKDAMQIIDENEFDRFNENGLNDLRSIGLIAWTIDEIMFIDVSFKSQRSGQLINDGMRLRTRFPESWLWQNVTIETSGSIRLSETAPDTTTSWYLTGFSIDPVYGLGIIKKPIQFTTVQPFYIVDNLPYSIRRGEVVALQFTLFNNLGAEYIADVTMYNVANQTEFIGRPLGVISYTKSVTVPPSVGKPVSFLVRAKALGEMVIRVKASMMLGLETDALEKVVPVIPERLVRQHFIARDFCFKVATIKSFPMDLVIPSNVDKGSEKIEYLISPLQITPIREDLNKFVSLTYSTSEKALGQLAIISAVLNYQIANKTFAWNQQIEVVGVGYYYLHNYLLPDGSYRTKRRRKPSVFLTALFATFMQSVYDMFDDNYEHKVRLALEWLVSKQHSSGRFDEINSATAKEMQGGLRDGISLTSYVLVALLENEDAKSKHAEAIQNGMKYLSSHNLSNLSAYDLSIVTYAMMLNGHTLKYTALNKLMDLAIYPYNGERCWDTEHSVETTAYALLSLVVAEKYLDCIPIMNWLAKQNFISHSFAFTQSSCVGLKALARLTEKITPSRTDFTIQLKYKTNTKKFHFAALNKATHYEIIDPEDVKFIDIQFDGIGCGLLQVLYKYSIDLRNFENRFQLDLEKQNTGSDYELKLR